jgi:hypothetical protein
MFAMLTQQQANKALHPTVPAAELNRCSAGRIVKEPARNRADSSFIPLNYNDCITYDNRHYVINHGNDNS